MSAGIYLPGPYPRCGGVMSAAEAELPEVPLRIDSRRPEEVTRHEVSGCGADAAERKGLALEVRQCLDAGIGTRHENALEARVFLAHRQPHGPLGPLHRLHRREAAVPDDVEPIGRQPLHGGRIVQHRNELDLHPHLLGDVVGEEFVLAQQLLRILVGDGGNPQHVRRRRSP